MHTALRARWARFELRWMRDKGRKEKGIQGKKEKKVQCLWQYHHTDVTILFSDNQLAIALTCNHQYHVHTKHIDVHYHFICWVVENRTLHLMYCLTADMLADTLTKVLPLLKVKHFAECLGLCTV